MIFRSNEKKRIYGSTRRFLKWRPAISLTSATARARSSGSRAPGMMNFDFGARVCRPGVVPLVFVVRRLILWNKKRYNF